MLENNDKLEFEGEDTLVPHTHKDGNIYPDAEVKVERAQFSVFELKRKLEKKQILVDPDFQRESLWDMKQKSELVESILMGIPLPLIYLTEDKKGKLIVVDGRQRLTSLFGFIDNEYQLSNLNIVTNINNKKFKELESKDQSAIEDYQLVSHVIKPPTPDQVKFDIFDRVNRGGTRLNNQEMRNALYGGKATKLLNNLSSLEIFKRATNDSISSKRMKDKYLILRFLSFYISYERLYPSPEDRVEYKSNMDEFLGKNMELINNKLNDETIYLLTEKFKTAMENAYMIFSKNAFRLPGKIANRKSPINMALFESLGYLLSKITVSKNMVSMIKKAYKEKIEQNKDVVQSLTYVVDSKKHINNRYEAMDNLARELNKQ